jgi:hypothetical protein
VLGEDLPASLACGRWRTRSRSTTIGRCQRRGDRRRPIGLECAAVARTLGCNVVVLGRLDR